MAQVLQLCDLVSVGKRHDLKNSNGPYHLFLWSDMVRAVCFFTLIPSFFLSLFFSSFSSFPSPRFLFA